MQCRIQVQELGLWDLWGDGWDFWGFAKGDGRDLVLGHCTGRGEYWTRDEVFRNILFRLEDKECFTGIPDLHAKWHRVAVDGYIDLAGSQLDGKFRYERGGLRTFFSAGRRTCNLPKRT